MLLAAQNTAQPQSTPQASSPQPSGHARIVTDDDSQAAPAPQAQQPNPQASQPAPQGQTPANQQLDQATQSAQSPQPASGQSPEATSAQSPQAADDNASSHMPTVGNKDTVTLPAGQQAQGQSGAQQADEENGTFVFHAQVEEVVLHATVVDSKGRLVTDLPKDAFTVYENGQPRQIKSVVREDIPVALGILIDNSGSMRDKRAKVNEAALNLVKSSNPQDKVFLVNFNEEFFLDQDFTGSVPKLRDALEKIDSRGGTAMYDAVDASAKYMEDNAKRLEDDFKIQKKVLLVVTDGEDNSSRDSLEQIVRKLQAENAPTVYTIGILGDEHSRKAKRSLLALSEQTGGLAFFPKDVNEVGEISQTIARDIRSQYTIVFKKAPGAQPGYHTIKVLAKAPGYKNLQVRTLNGYYAGQERASR
jgi:Ca-activated chloride channel homolog